MKKMRNILMAAVVAIFAMSACDIVEEPYFQGGDGPTPTPVGVTKKVLLEDFTGWRCVNCPAAAQGALQLQSVYPEQLIVLGVHAGDLSAPYFVTPEGTEWFNYFAFDHNPIGTINRVSTSGNYGFESGQWGAAVVEELQKEAVMALAVENTYDPATRALTCKVSGEIVEAQTDELSLVVCLMEDNIVGKQLTPDGMNNEYVHRHVFRTTLNGAWGESIGAAPFAEQTKFEKTYTMTISDEFNAENCAIIAYVYQNSDRAILQVEEAEVME